MLGMLKILSGSSLESRSVILIWIGLRISLIMTVLRLGKFRMTLFALLIAPAIGGCMPDTKGGRMPDINCPNLYIDMLGRPLGSKSVYEAVDHARSDMHKGKYQLILVPSEIEGLSVLVDEKFSSDVYDLKNQPEKYPALERKISYTTLLSFEGSNYLQNLGNRQLPDACSNQMLYMRAYAKNYNNTVIIGILRLR